MDMHAPVPELLEPLLKEKPFGGSREILVKYPDQSDRYHRSKWFSDRVLGFCDFSIQPLGHRWNPSSGPGGHEWVHLREAALYNTFGYPVKQLNDDEYVFPYYATGQGEPIHVRCFDMVVHFTAKAVTMRQATFFWYDVHLNEPNRGSGPPTVTIMNPTLNQNGLRWDSKHVSMPTLSPDSVLHEKMSTFDPFRNPYFSDPQDELQYQLEIP